MSLLSVEASTRAGDRKLLKLQVAEVEDMRQQIFTESIQVAVPEVEEDFQLDFEADVGRIWRKNIPTTCRCSRITGHRWRLYGTNLHGVHPMLSRARTAMFRAGEAHGATETRLKPEKAEVRRHTWGFGGFGKVKGTLQRLTSSKTDTLDGGMSRSNSLSK